MGRSHAALSSGWPTRILKTNQLWQESEMPRRMNWKGAAPPFQRLEEMKRAIRSRLGQSGARRLPILAGRPVSLPLMRATPA